MRTFRLITLLAATLFIQPAFASPGEDSATITKSCDTIANACLNAGYTRSDTPDKQFWLNCMRPIILGKTVQGVDIDKATAKRCRTDKIAELKNELKEFQKVSSRN